MCMSKPKVPAPTPVIERQPYKNAPSRASLSSGMDRPRQIPGVVTSARGVLEPASTTKRVMMGGDQQINPLLSAPACQSCHTAHAIQHADNLEWQLTVVIQCGTCLQDKLKTYREESEE